MSEYDKSMTILMADDDEDDRMMTKEAFEEAKPGYHLYFVSSGEELMDYLHQRGRYSDPGMSPRPNLILLDLNMPKKSGREALGEIKADPEFCKVPIVILTSSKEDVDIIRTHELGADMFVTKPVSYEGLSEVIKTSLSILLSSKH